MKMLRTKRIFGSLIMAVVMLFQCTVTAFADDAVVGTVDSRELAACLDIIESIPEAELPEVGVALTELTDEQAEAVNYVLAAELGEEAVASEEKAAVTGLHPIDTGYFYNQLNTYQKAVYEGLYTVCENYYNSVIDYSTNFIGNVAYNPKQIDRDGLIQLINLFYYSNPQYFFLINGFSYNTTYGILYPCTNEENMEYEHRNASKTTIENITKQWMAEINKLSNDLEKEKWIAKKLSDTITYTFSDYDQTLEGALVYNECVCNGYAMSMVYFCNLAGIDCITVVSDDHAWNRVKLFGNWYQADITWYDQDSTTFYWDIWLNKSEATYLAQDVAYNSTSHTVDNTYYEGITLPACTLNDPVAPVGSPKVTATAGAEQVTLKWNAVSGATKYNVYSYLDSKYTLLTTTTATNYTATGLTGGTKYGFLVRAYVNGVWSTFSDSDITYATPTAAVVKPTVTTTAGQGLVALKWNAVSGATKYNVYSYLDGKYTLLTTTNSTNYTATGLTGGTKYGFLVRAYVNNAWTAFTNNDVVYATPTAPAVTKPTVTAAAGTELVKLTWNAVSGATKYNVYSYLDSKYTLLTTTTATSYTATGLTGGTKYGFLVRAYVNNAWTAFTTADNVYATPTASIKPVLTLTAGNGKIAVRWNAISGATKYNLYIYNGEYTLLTSTTATNYVAMNLKNGTKYGFLVRAYINGVWTTFTTADNVYATPTAATKPVVTVTAGDNKATLTWNTLSGATKYNVYSYLDGKYTLLATNTTTTYRASGLTGGMKYGFLVRAYVNGAWTAFTTADVTYATIL